MAVASVAFARRSDVVASAGSIRSAVKPELLRGLTALAGGRLFGVEKTTDLGSICLSALGEFRPDPLTHGPRSSITAAIQTLS